MTKGERIKRLREGMKLTQEEMAKMLNTTKQTVSKYEKGIVTNIPSNRIEAMAKILNTSPEYILGWDDEQKKGAIQKDGPDEKKKDEIRRLFAQMSPDQQETFLLEGYRIVFGRSSEDHLSHPVKHSQEDDSGDYDGNH